MRWLIVIAWLVAGALSGASPALAHGPNATHAEKAAAIDPGSAPPQSATIAPSTPCRTVHAVVTGLSQSTFHAHHHTHGDEHDPADHHHPFGEDPLHQMSAHFSLDFATQSDAVPQRSLSSKAFAIALADVTASGVAVPPPVPPPLG